MKENSIDKKKIESLLPHREPMLLIYKLVNIVPLKSAKAIMHVSKKSFFVHNDIQITCKDALTFLGNFSISLIFLENHAFRIQLNLLTLGLNAESTI